MKKILNISLALLLVSVFCSTSTPNAKTKDNNNDIDLAIIPYVKILEKLSNEYGIKMYVSDEDKEKFYKSVSNMSPNQFEELQRKQYKEALKYIHETTPSYDSSAEVGSPYPTPIPRADKIIPAVPVE
ncbi:hypothetical protein ACH0B5_11050 [Ureibacillus sp. 179-F W5.1 NHS]|uniref:Lipoprotein n=1 Tax=Lysinibacillus halotolerans TaxID=1368476 RepID=A0A3M8HB27_9BACI|nr:hypothetical protein [Lysinibacillus halotolerans]RNC99576.1 hypothetical protein EC501_07460 [Lysinibacillus halotolerans]